MHSDIKTETHRVIPATGYARLTIYKGNGKTLITHLPIIALRCTVYGSARAATVVVHSEPVVLYGCEALSASEVREWSDTENGSDDSIVEIVRLATMGDRIGCPRSPGLIDAEGNPVREDGATR